MTLVDFYNFFFKKRIFFEVCVLQEVLNIYMSVNYIFKRINENIKVKLCKYVFFWDELRK